MKFKLGLGFDVHQLAEGLNFWLGGIKIDHYKGCVAHSDGDALIHAICDALLGAACLGDIGQHFPDTSSDYKNIDSKILLKKTYELVNKAGYTIGNIDSTICLQKPKIAPYIPSMRETLAQILNIPVNTLSIKATTTEKLGYVGQEEGVQAYAIVLLECGEISKNI